MYIFEKTSEESFFIKSAEDLADLVLKQAFSLPIHEAMGYRIWQYNHGEWLCTYSRSEGVHGSGSRMVDVLGGDGAVALIMRTK